METSRRVRCGAAQAWVAGTLLLVGATWESRADAPAPQGTAVANAPAGADADEPKTLPQDGLFSSIKQSLREGDQEIIRGHFEVGSPPNIHRYYCLMDPKSHRREPNGVVGEPISRPDGMTGIKSSAVSLYKCDKAEQQGLLVSSGYVLLGRAGARPARVAAAAIPAQLMELAFLAHVPPALLAVFVSGTTTMTSPCLPVRSRRCSNRTVYRVSLETQAPGD